MKALRDLQLLLVEDNYADAKLIVSMIDNALGCSCDQTGTFQSALEVLSVKRFDILLLDIVLPDIETLDGLSQINTRYPDLPVIIVTGLEEARALEAVERGAQDFLRKDSLSPDILARSVQYTLRRQEMQLELNRLKDQRRRDAATTVESLRHLPERFTAAPSAADPVPLRQRNPAAFAELRYLYQNVLQTYFDRIQNGSAVIGVGKTIGTRLADVDATPNDLTDIHLSVMEEIGGELDMDEVSALIIDGRMFVLEVMGHLANRFRERVGRAR